MTADGTVLEEETSNFALRGNLPAEFKQGSAVHGTLDFTLSDYYFAQNSDRFDNDFMIYPRKATLHGDQRIYRINAFVEGYKGSFDPEFVNIAICYEYKVVVMHFESDNRYLIGSADLALDAESIFDFYKSYFTVQQSQKVTIDWDLHGTWVDANGAVIEWKGTSDFSLSGTLPLEYEPMSTVKGELELIFGDGVISVNNNGACAIYADLATQHDNHHLYHITGYFPYPTQHEREALSFTVCIEKEIVVLHYNGDNLYLVASTDPNADPAEIFAFYDTYVHVPESE